ncbi:hypothetical protein YC2023_120247 [Brassica napus]
MGFLGVWKPTGALSQVFYKVQSNGIETLSLKVLVSEYQIELNFNLTTTIPRRSVGFTLELLQY